MANTVRILLMEGIKIIAERDFNLLSAQEYIVHESKMYQLARHTPPSSLNDFNGSAVYYPIRDVMYWDKPLGGPKNDRQKRKGK